MSPFASARTLTVPDRTLYLNGRLPNEAPHADDDFFNDGDMSNWTAVTPSGTATWTEDKVLSVVAVNQTSNHTPALVKAMTPTSSPVTIETRVTWYHRDPADSQQLAGLVFTDGTATTSNDVFFAPQQYASGGFYIVGGELNNRDGDGSPVTVLEAPSNWDGSGPLVFYLRLIWSAANTFEGAVSIDAVTWTDYGAGTFTATTITPTHFGFIVAGAGADFYQLATFDYFRVYESDLSV